MPDTGEKTHRAKARGYAGTLVEPGEFVSPGFPVGSWMEEAKPESEVEDAAAVIAKFDHDGDGRPGGSRKRRK